MTPRSRNSSVSRTILEDFNLAVQYDTRAIRSVPKFFYGFDQDQTNNKVQTWDHDGKSLSSTSSSDSERSNTPSSSTDQSINDSIYSEKRSFFGQVFGALVHFFLLPTQKGVEDFASNQNKHVQAIVSALTEKDAAEFPDLTPPYVTEKEHEDAYWGQHGASLGIEIDGDSADTASTVRSIALRLESVLRDAKKAHLQTSEVLLPPDLLSKIARDILLLAETEPCGIRGCMVILSFESGHQSPLVSSPVSTNPTKDNSLTNNNNYPAVTNALVSAELTSGNSRIIGTDKIDATTVTTFELHLSLREDLAPWYSRLPQILRNLAKGGTIVVSPAYTIAKKKLYRSH